MLIDTRAHIESADGDIEAAGALRQQAFSLVDGYWGGVYTSVVVVGLADHAVAVGRPADAVRLLAAAAALRGGPDRSRPDEARIDAAARAALGEDAHAAAQRRAAAALGGPPAERRRGALALARDAAAAVLRPLSAPAAG
jgi:hypothetical protein